MPDAGQIIARPGLYDLLNASGRVAVLSAPAGSGKTSLASSWISNSGLSERVAWVSVSRRDRDPQAFWLSVANALRDIGGSHLVREQVPAPDLTGSDIVERLLEGLRSIREPLYLVLDDLQELAATSVESDLQAFIADAPPLLRFLLLTRRDLRLGLHRLRVAGELTEIRADDLRFTVDEADTLLTKAGVRISADALKSLVASTEGWAAGLRLAALSMRRHPNPDSFAKTFSGRDRTVVEYLLAEVLERQPPEVARLLLRTSILEQVNGDLADRLTGGVCSDRILADLEAAGAFVVSIDSQQTWYRYHQLFADLLALELRRTAPDELRVVHDRAAAWFAEHGYPIGAIDHAQKAKNWRLAGHLLADHWFAFLLDGRRATAHALLAAFPSDVVASDAELGVLSAAATRRSGPDWLDKASGLLARAANRAPEVAEDRRVRFQLALAIVGLAIAAARNDLSEVAEKADKLLVATEPTETTDLKFGEDLRALAWSQLAAAEVWTGRSVEAEHHLEVALSEAQRIGRPLLELRAVAYRSLLEHFRAPLLSEEHARRAIELAQRHGLESQSSTAIAYGTLASVLLWRGLLEETRQWLDKAERALQPEVEPMAIVGVHGTTGLLAFAEGRYDDALRALQAADEIGRELVTPTMLATRVHAYRLQVQLRLGETDSVEHHLAGLDDTLAESLEMRVVRAMARLGQTDFEAALAALAPYTHDATNADRADASVDRRWLIEAFLLDATAKDALGDERSAARSVERALDLAEHEGLLLPFIYVPVRELLHRHPRTGTKHASLIVDILSIYTGSPRSSSRAQSEPLEQKLSDSELRVLRYLPTNLRAPEIATELSVSAATVRTHIRHVYAKLGVHTRAAAVQRARAIGLLAPSARQT